MVEEEKGVRARFGVKRALQALAALVAYHLFFPNILVNLIHRARGVRLHSLRHTVIAYHVLLDPIYPEMIEIEAGVWLTQHCKVLAHFRPTPQLAALIGGDRVRPVRICQGAYIGVGSIVLPGVTIGRCAVVGAGSVVTHDVPPHTLAAGNPARPIKPISAIRP